MKFIFPDDEPLEFKFNEGQFEVINDEFEFKNKNNSAKNNSAKNNSYSLTKTVKNYLNFMADNDLLPYLPSKINFVYVNENDKFFNYLADLLKRKYAYPASINPDNSNFYLSKDFELENSLISKNKKSSETNDIVLFRSYLNNDNQKVLEYVLGHELGHFFLLSKNHTNPKLDKNKFIQKIARNIEEGFSEAFSIQLMSLKDSNLNFNLIKNGRHYDSDLKLKNKTDESVLPEERFNYFQKIGFEKLIDNYDFKIIYDNLPIKDTNGNIEKNINKIYETCLKIAKDNNKYVINSILKNKTFVNDNLIYYFNNGLKTCIKEPNINNLSTQELIDKIHSKITGTSFNTTKIKMLRDKFLNIQNISIQNKL